MNGHDLLDRWQEFSELLRRSNAVFEELLKRLGAHEGPPIAFVPPCDIVRTPGEYLFRLAVPGVLEEDIDVTISGSVLTVRGERDNPLEVRGGRVLHRELTDGYFERSFRLPFLVTPEQVRLEYGDGMLLLYVRRPEEGG